MASVLLSLDYKVKVVSPTTGNIVINASEANIFDINLTGNAVLKAPQNPTDGQTILIRLNPATFAFTTETGVNGGFLFSASTPGLTGIAPNKINLIQLMYHAPLQRWLATSFMPNY